MLTGIILTGVGLGGVLVAYGRHVDRAHRRWSAAQRLVRLREERVARQS